MGKRTFDWDKELKKAQEALDKNKRLIDSTPQGTPSGKESGYKVGKSPSRHKQKY